MCRITKLAIGLLVLVSLPAIVYAGGQGEPKAKEQPVTIVRYWTSETDPSSMECDFSITRSYEEKNPNVRIQTEYLPYEDMWTKLMASKRAGTEPEIVYAAPWEAESMMGKGWLVPLTDVVNRIGKDSFLPQALGPFTKDGEVFAITSQTDVWQLFYRADFLSEAALTPPKYEDDFLAVAKKLTVDTNGDGKIDRYGFTQAGQSWISEEQFVMELWAQGGYFFDTNNNVAFDTTYHKESLEALNYLQELAKYCPPGLPACGYNEMAQYYTNSQVATIRYPGRLISHIERNNPEIGNQTKAVMFPIDRNKKIGVTFNGGDTWIMFKGSKNSAVGKDFLYSYMTGENYALFLRSVPLHMFPSHHVEEYSKVLRGYPEWQKYAQVWDNQVQMMTTPGVAHAIAYEHPGTLNPYMGDVLGSGALADQLNKFFAGQLSAEEVIKNSAASWKKTVDEMKKKGI
jgi:ABC-type glycerol-3-phosphate transport system substrate-binding protein